MDPINVEARWSWSNFICGVFCGAAGLGCAFAGCSIDGPLPIADAVTAKVGAAGGMVTAAFAGGLAG